MRTMIFINSPKEENEWKGNKKSLAVSKAF